MGGRKVWEANLSFIQHFLIESESWASCQALGKLVENMGMFPALKKLWFFWGKGYR